MKKYVSLIAAALFILSLFAGCGAVEKNNNVVNGTFKEYLVAEKVGNVYDPYGEKLFSYDLTGYIPTSFSNGYYCASKYQDGSSKYVVMDKTGKVISSEFDTYITIYGEIALDSSVPFGGDSAALTADGKTFLNKFIKAYTSVAFSGQYEGFISKTMVEGHTAPIEGSTYASGLQLSEERAANVKDYCLSSDTGVDVSKIKKTLEDVGYSNSKPVYGSDGKVNLAACRRVSFRFIVNVDF